MDIIQNGDRIVNKIMYSARLSYGEPSLIKITITNETPKTIAVSSKKIVIGDSWSQSFGYKRVYKDGLNLFGTLVEAAEYLVQELKNDTESLKRRIDQNKQSAGELEMIRLNNV